MCVCVCVCVWRESWYVGGCNYFQLGVHYEYILKTLSFRFSNLRDIVCVFNIMLIQFIMYLVVYISSVSCVCVCVCRESWYVGGSNYFQLAVHYEYILKTSSFRFSNSRDIVCVFNIMLIQFVMHLAVYISSALCGLSRNCVLMEVG